MIILLLVSLAGGLGAATRFILDTLIRRRTAGRFPLGTMIINISGSFLLGLVTGLALSLAVSEHWRAILGTGFLGGYTTFSTASFETVRLVQRRRYAAAALNGLGTLAGSLAAAALGLLLGLAA